MSKETKTLELWANDTKEATELKEELEKSGWIVSRVYTGNQTPIAMTGNGLVYNGAGNIRTQLTQK